MFFCSFIGPRETLKKDTRRIRESGRTVERPATPVERNLLPANYSIIFREEIGMKRKKIIALGTSVVALGLTAALSFAWLTSSLSTDAAGVTTARIKITGPKDTSSYIGEKNVDDLIGIALPGEQVILGGDKLAITNESTRPAIAKIGFSDFTGRLLMANQEKLPAELKELLDPEETGYIDIETAKDVEETEEAFLVIQEVVDLIKRADSLEYADLADLATADSGAFSGAWLIKGAAYYATADAVVGKVAYGNTNGYVGFVKALNTLLTNANLPLDYSGLFDPSNSAYLELVFGKGATETSVQELYDKAIAASVKAALQHSATILENIKGQLIGKIEDKLVRIGLPVYTDETTGDVYVGLGIPTDDNKTIEFDALGYTVPVDIGGNVETYTGVDKIDSLGYGGDYGWDGAINEQESTFSYQLELKAVQATDKAVEDVFPGVLANLVDDTKTSVLIAAEFDKLITNN
jgi:hypothetical protein